MSLIKKLERWIGRLESDVGFMKVPTNWHKHPKISDFLCGMGRHDLKLITISVKNSKEATATLLCPFCGFTEESSITPFDQN